MFVLYKSFVVLGVCSLAVYLVVRFAVNLVVVGAGSFLLSFVLGWFWVVVGAVVSFLVLLYWLVMFAIIDGLLLVLDVAGLWL